MILLHGSIAPSFILFILAIGVFFALMITLAIYSHQKKKSEISLV